MIIMRLNLVFLVLLVFLTSICRASDFRLQGQASAWLLGNYAASAQAQAGLRYIPTFSAGLPVGQSWKLDGELAVNAFSDAVGWPGDSLRVEAQVTPYRLWGRVSSSRFETRIGLQKINFGSATLLRPLMWFDRIDPRDPLQMTDGVYALLTRYYFSGDANIWAWGLLGNDSTKGWEVYPSLPWSPEVGGRAQVPTPRGEIALTGHFRRFSFESAIPEMPARGRELRLGADGKWDIGIGLWFEGVANYVWSDPSLWSVSRWQKTATVGADYTFGLGNGLTLLAEHMALNMTDSLFDLSELVHITALTASYPLGVVDNLRALVYYDWRNKGVYRYLSWQRTLDNWIFSVAAFWNPDHASGIAGTSATSSAAGKGLMVMVVFNH
jgi:hypothetical protein